MNNKVSVTGMQVKTKVSNNLFVAPTTIAATGHAEDALFGASHNFADAAKLLQPVSTIDGKNFFYTDSQTNVSANGSAREKQYIALNTGAANPTSDQLNSFNTTNGTDGAVGFVDYVMELKAVNGEASAKDLKLTKLDLVYNGLPATEKAIRVAVFMEKYNGTAYTTVSSETLPAAKSIFSKDGAVNFETGNAASAVDNRGAVLTPNATITESVDAGKTEYYKVVVRLWLEGEDKTCNNDTYASLSQNWVLDFQFEFGTATANTNKLGSAAIAASASEATGSITLTDSKLSNGEVPASYQWLDSKGINATGTSNTPSYTATSTGVYYCKVTTNKGNVYYTDGLTLTVA